VSLQFFIDIILLAAGQNPPRVVAPNEEEEEESFWQHYGPEVNSASNRNEYQEYFLRGKSGWCIRLTTLPPSCAECLEIWKPEPPGTLRACPGL